MVDLVVLHWRPDARLGVEEAASRFAAAKKWRLSERCVAIVEYWVRAQLKRWITEEAAKARRTHTLLEDNPTSG